MDGRKSVHEDADGTTPSTLLFGYDIGNSSAASTCRKSKSGDSQWLSLAMPETAAESGMGCLTEGIHHSESHLKKREIGKPWSEEEHRSFIEGLEKLGKGHWKGISQKYVQSRTPMQVATHAQKYFNRLNVLSSNSKRRRSIFDISLNNNVNQQPSQGSQSNNIVDIASSSSDASTENVINLEEEEEEEEPKVMEQNHATILSEIPPTFATIEPQSHLIYQQPTNVPLVQHQTQAIMSGISWVPVVVNYSNRQNVVNYSNQQNVVYLPNSDRRSYTAAVRPWPSQDMMLGGGGHGFKEVQCRRTFNHKLHPALILEI